MKTVVIVAVAALAACVAPGCDADRSEIRWGGNSISDPVVY